MRSSAFACADSTSPFSAISFIRSSKASGVIKGDDGATISCNGIGMSANRTNHSASALSGNSYLLGPQQDLALFATLLGLLNVVVRIKATSFPSTFESVCNLSDRPFSQSGARYSALAPRGELDRCWHWDQPRLLLTSGVGLGRSMIGLRFQVRCIPFSLSVVGCPPLRLTRDQHTLSASFGPIPPAAESLVSPMLPNLALTVLEAPAIAR